MVFWGKNIQVTTPGLMGTELPPAHLTPGRFHLFTGLVFGMEQVDGAGELALVGLAVEVMEVGGHAASNHFGVAGI